MFFMAKCDEQFRLQVVQAYLEDNVSLRTLALRHGVGRTVIQRCVASYREHGKAVLIAGMLPFVNRYPDRPLIWNAGWKMVIYATIAMLFHYAEKLFDYWKDAHNIAAANHELLTHINWAHFWAIQILLFVLVGNYCVLAEIGWLLGKGVLKAMFVGPLSTVPRKNLTQYQV
ncbi:hypothetical protein PUN4_450136 [Paraburkholderia unamae]|nr:hypothetical protein PUN4_450136 [Paraburkholderia unamae]